MIENIKSFFKNLKIYFSRKFQRAIPCDNGTKTFGNLAEDDIYKKLLEQFKDAIILRNVCLNEDTAIGDVDFIVIYKLKVFVIELKCWKGDVYQVGEKFFKYKKSYEDTFKKQMPSPIKQLNNIVYKLKKTFKNIWFEKILLFKDTDSVSLKQDFIYFTNFNDMHDYIINNGKTNKIEDINFFLRKIKVYDTIFSKGLFLDRMKKCIVLGNSLNFQYEDRAINKNDIKFIKITHFKLYDSLLIALNNKENITINLENGSLNYIYSGSNFKVGLSKIDYIEIGNNQL